MKEIKVEKNGAILDNSKSIELKMNLKSRSFGPGVEVSVDFADLRMVFEIEISSETRGDEISVFVGREI